MKRIRHSTQPQQGHNMLCEQNSAAYGSLSIPASKLASNGLQVPHFIHSGSEQCLEDFVDSSYSTIQISRAEVIQSTGQLVGCALVRPNSRTSLQRDQ